MRLERFQRNARELSRDATKASCEISRQDTIGNFSGATAIGALEHEDKAYDLEHSVPDVLDQARILEEQLVDFGSMKHKVNLDYNQEQAAKEDKVQSTVQGDIGK